MAYDLLFRKLTERNYAITSPIPPPANAQTKILFAVVSAGLLWQVAHEAKLIKERTEIRRKFYSDPWSADDKTVEIPFETNQQLRDPVPELLPITEVSNELA